MPNYPLERTSNSGRQITIDPHEDHPRAGSSLATTTKRSPIWSRPKRERPIAPTGWSSGSFRSSMPGPETTVLGPPDEPPIDGALFYVDLMLDEADED